LFLSLAAASAVVTRSLERPSSTEWRYFGGDKGFTRYSALDQINRDNWNPMTGDEALGHVYIPLAAPTAAWYGGWRPGDNLFANTLVALDVKAGRRVWHFQTVHHDLWDSDNIGPPMLGDITVDGRRIKAVVQENKAALFLGEGSNAVSGVADVDWAWGKKFRAYDKATGRVIWGNRPACSGASSTS
jgi:glucose dehydrogenase